jgi:hypothetical protein
MFSQKSIIDSVGCTAAVQCFYGVFIIANLIDQ